MPVFYEEDITTDFKPGENIDYFEEKQDLDYDKLLVEIEGEFRRRCCHFVLI